MKEGDITTNCLIKGRVGRWAKVSWPSPIPPETFGEQIGIYAKIRSEPPSRGRRPPSGMAVRAFSDRYEAEQEFP